MNANVLQNFNSLLKPKTSHEKPGLFKPQIHGSRRQIPHLPQRLLNISKRVVLLA